MRIAITGSTGMIGSKLVFHFIALGHEVIQITRHSSAKISTPVIVWNPAQGYLNTASLEGVDVVIHLAGASVGEKWTPGHKEAIFKSRSDSTKTLSNALAQLLKKPKVLISASAIGFYGNHPTDHVLDEESPAGIGFLPEVCKRWEEETGPAKEAGIRVVNMRIGVVLSKKGGALAKMWWPFQLGLGGVLGSGDQMMSWISLEEIPFIVDYLIDNNISGPVNVVSPNPVTNREFTKTLGKVIKRPTIFPVPAPGVKLLFGEMGENLLLEGSRVLPKVLQQRGYHYKYADLYSALQEAVR